MTNDELENTVTLRRKIDKDIVDNQREDRRRLDDVIHRLSTADAKLNSMQSEFNTMREFGTRVQEVQTDIVEKLTELSVRFVEHIEQESEERALMKAMAEQLKETAIQLRENSMRTNYLERGMVLIMTACTAVVTGGVGWIIHHLST